MIQLSGRFLKYNLIDKNGVQFPKSATIKIPSKVFVLFNYTIHAVWNGKIYTLAKMITRSCSAYPTPVRSIVNI